MPIYDVATALANIDQHSTPMPIMVCLALAVFFAFLYFIIAVRMAITQQGKAQVGQSVTKERANVQHLVDAEAAEAFPGNRMMPRVGYQLRPRPRWTM